MLQTWDSHERNRFLRDGTFTSSKNKKTKSFLNILALKDYLDVSDDASQPFIQQLNVFGKERRYNTICLEIIVRRAFELQITSLQQLFNFWNIRTILT